MSTADKYRTDKSLFSVWQQTQASYFKPILEGLEASRIGMAIMKAGKVFAELSNSLERIPSFDEFVSEYEK